MNKMKCYKVTCMDNSGNTYVVGVMTTDEYAAQHSAINSLLEGKHVVSKVISTYETNEI